MSWWYLMMNFVISTSMRPADEGDLHGTDDLRLRRADQERLSRSKRAGLGFCRRHQSRAESARRRRRGLHPGRRARLQRIAQGRQRDGENLQRDGGRREGEDRHAHLLRQPPRPAAREADLIARSFPISWTPGSPRKIGLAKLKAMVEGTKIVRRELGVKS